MDKTSEELEDIVEFVKRALVNEPNRDLVKSLLSQASQSEPKEMIDLLVRMHKILFPEGAGKMALIDPEEMDTEFMDFILDDGMWDYIFDISKNGIGTGDEQALSLIKDSIEDLVSRDVILKSNEAELVVNE